jgi:6-phosphogluconolactonase
VDPAGRYAYVEDFSSNTILGFNIDASSGALSPMTAPSGALPPGATIMVLSR